MKRVEWTQERLDKVKKYCGSSFDDGSLTMLFSFVAADNDIDKDNERFSLKSLKTISSMLVGKVGHIGLSNEKQALARVVESNVRIDSNKRTKSGSVYIYVEAIAYIKRTPATEKICEKIENDEITEISLGVSCKSKQRTSECVVASDVNEVYEWSLVPPIDKNVIRFAIKGNDDNRYVAEAPKDITLEQLLEQMDRIIGAYGAMGIGTYEENFDGERTTDFIFDYDSVMKTGYDTPYKIFEEEK